MRQSLGLQTRSASDELTQRIISHFGRRFRQWLDMRGLRLVDVAEKLGLSYHYVAFIGNFGIACKINKNWRERMGIEPTHRLLGGAQDLKKGCWFKGTTGFSLISSDFDTILITSFQTLPSAHDFCVETVKPSVILVQNLSMRQFVLANKQKNGGRQNLPPLVR